MKGRKAERLLEYAQDGESRGGAALLPQQTSGSGLASWERLAVDDSLAPTTPTLDDTRADSGLFSPMVIF